GWFDGRFAGERIPTLEEVFSLIAEHRGGTPLVAVDLKQPGLARDVVRLAQRQRCLDRLLFIGKTISDPNVREELKAESADAQTAVLAAAAEQLDAALAERHADWIYLRFLPSADEMAKIRGAGKRTFIAGPLVAEQAPDNWRRAAELGIDAILTDLPLDLAAQQKK